ncbi:hypothetical protein [Thiocystis violacea]|uniref:hypothetical protein n=1 Tax=Thiocystis violacea TaxID=13725 RepID=UPI0019041EF9|nr:hypothetical protein [Thiocystis violacea]MBK1721467.1 hypothetical protein [Thiocystis violacea]
MRLPVDEATRKAAKAPHELAMVNLIVCNLLIGVALLAGSMAQPDSAIAHFKWVALAAPLVVSLTVIGITWRRAAGAQRRHWFVSVHWRLATSRYRLVLASYVVCAAILSLAWLGGANEADIEAQVQGLSPAMQEMERHKLASQDMGSAVWARLGVVPLLLAVMVSIMLESGAIEQAGRGEIPDALAERFPPPPELQGDTEKAP